MAFRGGGVWGQTLVGGKYVRTPTDPGSDPGYFRPISMNRR
jgi:hypothetical protein